MKLILASICLLSVGALVQALSDTCTMEHCSDCIDYQPQCEICPAGTAKTDDLMKCVSCSDNCAECVAPTEDSLACTVCASGYFLVDGECTQCDANCDVCASVEACGTCNSGYYVNGDSGCSGCTSRCKSCSNADSCSVCFDGSYMDGDSCKACGTNIAKCRLDGDNVVVTECDEGYVINDGASSCLRCPSECSACSNEANGNDAKCTACDPSYFLNGDVCTACTDYCEACEDTTTCQTCEEEYTLKSADVKTCQACTLSKCIDCDVDGDGEDCTECEDGYFVDENACTPCLDNCKDCTDATTCTECDDGYDHGIKADTTTTECFALPDNCIEIDEATPSDTAACTACADGFGEDSAACIACSVTDCAECSTDAADCTECVDGKGLQTDATPDIQCMTIPDNCKSLDADANSATAVCEVCEDGYRVNTGACVDCEKSNSVTCTVDEAAVIVTVTCKSGFFEDSLECKSCPSSCDVCSDADTCTTCKAGYGLTSDDLCEACGDSCEDCLADVTDCVDCADGTTVDDNGACHACPDNCDDCDWVAGAASCTDCDVGYTIKDGECQACPMLCDECADVTVDGEEILSCTDCSEGYGKNEYLCADCPTHCTTCAYQTNTGVVCSACESGWVVSEGVCIACPSNCLECDTRGVCKDCQSGYGLSFDKKSCVVCSELTIENCATCTDHPDYENDTASCSTCNGGYYLKDNYGNGTDAECLQISDVALLDCGAATVVDLAPMCQENGCALGFSNIGGICGKICYRCGDPRIDASVDADSCVTTNTTDTMWDFCPAGTCMSVRTKIDGEFEVLTGCEKPSVTCEEGCLERTIDGQTVEVCSKCCTTPGCNDYANDETAYDSASFLSSSVLLMTALSMLLRL